MRHLSQIIALAALATFGCSDPATPQPDRSIDSEVGRFEAREEFDGFLWSLTELNGQEIPTGPGSGEIYTTHHGGVLWFEGGCGFSVAVAGPETVVRDPHRISRPCSAVDLEKLAAVEAMMRDGGAISFTPEEVRISASGDRTAIFTRQMTWDPRE